MSLPQYVRERHSQLQPPTSPNPLSRTGALPCYRDRQKSRQTLYTEPRQVHCSMLLQRCQPHSEKDCPLCSANQPVNEGKPLQMWCTKRKLQSEKEFCLTGLRETVIAKLAPSSLPQLLITILRKKNHSPEGVNNCAILKDTLRKVNIYFRGSCTFLPLSILPSLHPWEPHNIPMSPP